MPMLRKTRIPDRRTFIATISALPALGIAPGAEEEFVPLFNGKDLTGWEGDPFLWKVENGMIVGRSPGIGYNDFLTTEKEYGDFVLRFEIRLLHNVGNSGIQVRSRRAPGSMEMIGYQADVGPSWWGSLYDESRRRVTLAKPSEATLRRALKVDAWNEYEVQAIGKRIVLKLNGTVTVDYTEDDDAIEQTGLIGLQVHSGPPLEVRFRNIRIQER